jgi:lipid-A-disaccharide synthase
MDKEVVTELIQNDFNSKKLKSELIKILDTENRDTIFEAYFELERKLGGAGASEKTAQLIYKSIKK